MRNYTTQMDAARKNIITPEMEKVAAKERMTPEEIRAFVAEGKVAICANKNHKCLDPQGVGSMLKTKINVNLGVSRDCKDYDIEMQKVMEAVNMGADAINQLWRAKKIRAVGIKRAKLLVEVAANSIGVKQGVNAARCEISMLIEDFLKKKEQEQRVIEILETLCIQVPNADKLLNIKGVGILTVASFLGEVGDIRRFDSPKQIQKLAGLAITENSSGKYKGQSCISKRGRKLLRYTLFQAVMSMIMHLPEFKELHRYYTTRAKNPLKGKQSKVALCCKVIRIFYVLLNKGVEYDSQKLMKDIVRPEVIVA